MHAHPPPYGEYYPNEKRGGNVCCRCICWCCCILFFLILIFAALTAFLYMYYDPKFPTYKFESVDVKEFGYLPDSSVNADLIITLRADNPNKAITIIYEEDSSINVTYSNSTICSGKFPSFHHGHNNVTLSEIEVKGKNQLGSGVYGALQEDERRGKIPLKVEAKVPMRLVLGAHKLSPFTILASFTLSVHDLKLGKKPSIEEGKPTYRLEKK